MDVDVIMMLPRNKYMTKLNNISTVVTLDFDTLK